MCLVFEGHVCRRRVSSEAWIHWGPQKVLATKRPMGLEHPLNRCYRCVPQSRMFARTWYQDGQTDFCRPVHLATKFSKAHPYIRRRCASLAHLSFILRWQDWVVTATSKLVWLFWNVWILDYMKKVWCCLKCLNYRCIQQCLNVLNCFNYGDWLELGYDVFCDKHKMQKKNEKADSHCWLKCCNSNK